VAGTLNVANGGTGATTFTANRLLRGNGAGALQLAGIFDQSSAEAMRIDSSGNVGIGTSNPLIGLDVSGQGVLTEANSLFSSNLYFDGGWKYRGNGFGGVIKPADTGGGMTFFSSPNNTSGAGAAASVVEAMRIVPTGDVGIGTSSPVTRLHVAGTGSGSTLRLENQTASTGKTYEIISGDGGPLRFQDITAGSERMRIDSSGNVGIGLTSPGAKLDVAGTIQSKPAAGTFPQFNLNSLDSGKWKSLIAFQNSGTNKWEVGVDPSNNGTNSLYFYDNAAGSERMRIDSSGNLLVGTTTASAKVAVVSNAFNGLFINAQGAASNGAFEKDNTAGGYLVFNYNDGVSVSGVGSITTNGTVVTYNVSSDARVKHDIVDAPEASSLIDAIRVRSFKWNVNNSEQRYGFIAQELLEVAPEAVHQPDNPEEIMGVDYSKLVPMLVKEIQSLRARVAQLEGK
jgi:hypothetical protein